MQVRAATEGDTPFLVRLAGEAYRDLVTRQFGIWVEGVQARALRGQGRAFAVQGWGGGRSARFAAVSSSVHADHVFLNEILVLPEFQGTAGSAASCSNAKSAVRGNSAFRCGCTR